MDIFGTIITSATIIYTFLDGCAEYSDEARSLAARFKWDLRAIQHVAEYFEQRTQDSSVVPASDEDEALLADVQQYLEVLSRRAAASSSRIQAQGWLKTTWNRATWFHRQKELKEIEKELFDWTTRFDVRVLALPQRVKTVIPGYLGDTSESPKVLQSNRRITEFHKLAIQAQSHQAESLFLEDVPAALNPDGVSSPVQNRQQQQVEYRGQPVLLEPHPYDSRNDIARIERLKDDLGVLAAVLSLLESGSGVNILKTEAYFLNKEANQFVFIQRLPSQVSKASTLRDLISATGPRNMRLPAMHALSERFRFAQRLATAVFFIHATGFVHKAISSHSVYVFEPEAAGERDQFPYVLGEPFLSGFESIRSSEGWSDWSAHPTANGHPGYREELWEGDIYRHPDRQAGKNRARYINSYDVYSLGVVLLELGLWRPMSRFREQLENIDADMRQARIIIIAKDLDISMGPKYRSIVQWCLGLDGRESVSGTTFINVVLNKLDELVEIVSL
jgi:hypothetical protein